MHLLLTSVSIVNLSEIKFVAIIKTIQLSLERHDLDFKYIDR